MVSFNGIFSIFLKSKFLAILKYQQIHNYLKEYYILIRITNTNRGFIQSWRVRTDCTKNYTNCTNRRFFLDKCTLWQVHVIHTRGDMHDISQEGTILWDFLVLKHGAYLMYSCDDLSIQAKFFHFFTLGQVFLHLKM